jgi:hypothetical protein
LCTALHTIVLLFSSILCHVLVHTHDTTVIVLTFCTMYPSSEYIWSSGTGLPDCPSGVGELDFRIVHPEYNGLSIRSSGTGLPDCPSGVQELGFRIVHPEYSISYYTGRGETLHGLPDLVHLELHFRNQLMDTLDISLLLPFRLDPFIVHTFSFAQIRTWLIRVWFFRNKLFCSWLAHSRKLSSSCLTYKML